MDASWQEVSSGEQVVQALGLPDVGVPDLERLLLAPDSAAYLRVEVDEGPSARETFDLRVAGTRFYFNVTACKSLKGDIAIALAAYLTTHNVPVAAFAAALRKLNDNLSVLTPEEMAAVRAIVRPHMCPFRLRLLRRSSFRPRYQKSHRGGRRRVAGSPRGCWRRR
jgi:hypothetical protein